MCPIRPNVVWALDFQFDQIADGRALKLLNVIDVNTGLKLTSLHRLNLDPPLGFTGDG
jgi:hypothetical protein